MDDYVPRAQHKLGRLIMANYSIVKLAGIPGVQLIVQCLYHVQYIHHTNQCALFYPCSYFPLLSFALSKTVKRGEAILV